MERLLSILVIYSLFWNHIQGQLAEWCEDSVSLCYFVTEDMYEEIGPTNWNCGYQYGAAYLARPTVAEAELIETEIPSLGDLDDVYQYRLGGVFPGYPYYWVWYQTTDTVPADLQGPDGGEYLYLNRGPGSSFSYLGNYEELEMHGLCQINQTAFDGSTHLVLKVSAGSGDAVAEMWKGNDSNPDLDSEFAAGLTILADDSYTTSYKSPIVDCAWDFIKQVHIGVQLWDEDADVAFMNFNVIPGSTKEGFFTQQHLTGASWEDLWEMSSYNFEEPDEEIVYEFMASIDGYSESDVSRRWLIQQGEEVETCEDFDGWFVVLEPDHTPCTDWDSADSLPAFLFASDPEVAAGADLEQADYMYIEATLETGAFGGDCISTCEGVSDGQYQSCIGCNVYANCASEVLTYAVCMNGQVWEQSSGTEGSCSDSSSTCTDRNAYATCMPNGCDPNPCLNSGACSMASGGWECSCSGYEGDICETEIDECDSNPCVNGACTDGVNSYSCACDSGWEGTNCANDIDDCADDPCVNGDCTDEGVDSYSCACDSGWEGTNCANDIDDCADDPCVNGDCTDEGVDSYSCACDSGWEGGDCDSEIDGNDSQTTTVAPEGTTGESEDEGNRGNSDAQRQNKNKGAGAVIKKHPEYLIIPIAAAVAVAACCCCILAAYRRRKKKKEKEEQEKRQDAEDQMTNVETSKNSTQLFSRNSSVSTRRAGAKKSSTSTLPGEIVEDL